MTATRLLLEAAAIGPATSSSTSTAMRANDRGLVGLFAVDRVEVRSKQLSIGSPVDLRSIGVHWCGGASRRSSARVARGGIWRARDDDDDDVLATRVDCRTTHRSLVAVDRISIFKFADSLSRKNRRVTLFAHGDANDDEHWLAMTHCRREMIAVANQVCSLLLFFFSFVGVDS